MAGEPFGTTGILAFVVWSWVAILCTVSPHRFFKVLSFGRLSLPSELNLPFRVLGVVNAVGSAYMIARLSAGFR